MDFGRGGVTGLAFDVADIDGPERFTISALDAGEVLKLLEIRLGCCPAGR